MENIEKLLKQVLENQIEMQKDLKEIKSDLNAIKDQTADLTEFRTGTNQNFTDINPTVVNSLRWQTLQLQMGLRSRLALH